MTENEYIEFINARYLQSYQEAFIETIVSAIGNKHLNFEPYKTNPKHYILSIYDPLELFYVLLGSKNLSIRLPFISKEIIDNELLNFYNLDLVNPDSIYDNKVIAIKRRIEYTFLKDCLNKIEKVLSQKIQLYITQHLTEVSYDITNMTQVEAEYLWENLEN